jgi:hypothetical protein
MSAMTLIARSALYSPVPHGGFGGDPVTALAMLREAESVAGPHASPFLLTWLHSRRVEDYASCSEPSASDQSFESATRCFSQIRSLDEGFFRNWTSGRLIGYQGSAAVLLKRPQRAIATVEGPLKQTPPTLASERSFLLIILGAAYADEQEVRHSCALLSEAFRLATQVGLAERVRRVKGTRRQHLEAWANHPAVRELDEQLLAS